MENISREEVEKIKELYSNLYVLNLDNNKHISIAFLSNDKPISEVRITAGNLLDIINKSMEGETTVSYKLNQKDE